MKRRADEYQRQLELEKQRRARLYGGKPLENIADKVPKVPKPQLGDLNIFKKGNFNMREFKERQDMADLAKFKELENLEMEKMGKDADGTEEIAEIVQSKTQ